MNKLTKKMDFLRWYKNIIESNDQEPPESAWENIQDDLDVEQSWEVIDEYLTKKAAAKRNYILAGAASILIVIAFGIYRYSNLNLKEKEIKSVTESVNHAGTEKSDMGNNANNKFITEERVAGKTKESSTLKDKNKRALLVVKEVGQDSTTERKTEYNKEIKPTDDLIFEKIDLKKEFSNFAYKPGIITGEQNVFNTEKDNVHERKAFKKLYIGSTWQIANTWLLNEKTYNGLERSTLTASNTTFGSNFGVYIGTNIAKSIDLQMDINILAKNNQSYNEYLNGKYINDKLTLNYSQVVLSFRYYKISRRFMQGEHGINMGGYLGYLHNASQMLDNEIINLSNDYNTLDYGVFLSYEYVIPIYRQLGLGTGVRIYYGLKNIYTGNENIPAYLNKTNTASVNITFTLKYNLK